MRSCTGRPGRGGRRGGRAGRVQHHVEREEDQREDGDQRSHERVEGPLGVLVEYLEAGGLRGRARAGRQRFASVRKPFPWSRRSSAVTSVSS